LSLGHYLEKKDNMKVRKSIYQRIRLWFLYRKIRKKYKYVDGIFNTWTDYRSGWQNIQPLLLYSDDRYVYSNGVPVYDLKLRIYNDIDTINWSNLGRIIIVKFANSLLNKNRRNEK
jgi:hypothetical protein